MGSITRSLSWTVAIPRSAVVTIMGTSNSPEQQRRIMRSSIPNSFAARLQPSRCACRYYRAQRPIRQGHRHNVDIPSDLQADGVAAIDPFRSSASVRHGAPDNYKRSHRGALHRAWLQAVNYYFGNTNCTSSSKVHLEVSVGAITL
jgi:hypothetical protein